MNKCPNLAGLLDLYEAKIRFATNIVLSLVLPIWRCPKNEGFFELRQNYLPSGVWNTLCSISRTANLLDRRNKSQGRLSDPSVNCRQ
jgi:dsDNA-specific endonuclease/ATPase MutS2